MQITAKVFLTSLFKRGANLYQVLYQDNVVHSFYPRNRHPSISQLQLRARLKIATFSPSYYLESTQALKQHIVGNNRRNRYIWAFVRWFYLCSNSRWYFKPNYISFFFQEQYVFLCLRQPPPPSNIFIIFNFKGILLELPWLAPISAVCLCKYSVKRSWQNWDTCVNFWRVLTRVSRSLCNQWSWQHITIWQA